MEPLPTLGGPNGFATGSNNHQQVVGWAENTRRDQSCTGDQVLQFRAVRWEVATRDVHELPPLERDSTSAATAISDIGLTIGISGECDQAVGRLSARAAVVWEHGRPRRLEDLGGVAWNTPMSLNHRGDVVGFVNSSRADGQDFRPLPVWWPRPGPVRVLDLPDGYPLGEALGINARRQIVGE